MEQQDSTPYCGNCGYSLQGLTESSKCPECGKPIVDVLVRASIPGQSKRYRSQATLFGIPLICIAYGPSGPEKIGKPVGIIAMGDAPRGVIAIGGRAVGVVAFGGMAFGVIASGGMAVGLVTFGGLSIGLLAVGGIALGVFGVGGLVIAFAGGGAGGLVYRVWPW